MRRKLVQVSEFSHNSIALLTSYFRYHISVARLAKQRSALIKAVSSSVLLVIESSGET